MQQRSVGEVLRGFLVIVVGVLTALALEAGWQEWQDSQRGAEYLEALRSELAQNAEAAERERTRSVDLIATLVEVAALVESGEIEGRELEIAEGLIFPAQMTGSFPEVSRVVLEDLKSTGNLRLIADSNLRRTVAQAYGRMDSQLERLDLNSARVNSTLLSHLAQSGLRAAARNGDPAATGAILRGFRSDPEFSTQVRLERERLHLVDFYLSNVALFMTEAVSEIDAM